MNDDLPKLTFAILDTKKGIPYSDYTTEEEYPLPAWYRSIRNIPLDDLGVEDISKACRQGVHLEQVVPLAFKLIKANPVEGEMKSPTDDPKGHKK